MFGIFADVFKRATYQDDHDAPCDLRADGRPPFHWSAETRRRKGWRGDHDG